MSVGTYDIAAGTQSVLNGSAGTVNSGNPSWNPAGNWSDTRDQQSNQVVYVQCPTDNSKCQLWSVSATGGVSSNLTNDASHWSDIEPAWNIDGSRLVYVRSGYDPAASPVAGEDSHIVTMNADGSAKVDISARTLGSTPNTREVDPAWSPDRHTIVFSSDRDRGGFRIYTMKDDGTGVQLFTINRPGNFRHPHFTQDGRAVVFVNSDTGETFMISSDSSKTVIKQLSVATDSNGVLNTSTCRRFDTF